MSFMLCSAWSSLLRVSFTCCSKKILLARLGNRDAVVETLQLIDKGIRHSGRPFTIAILNRDANKAFLGGKNLGVFLQTQARIRHASSMVDGKQLELLNERVLDCGTAQHAKIRVVWILQTQSRASKGERFPNWAESTELMEGFCCGERISVTAVYWTGTRNASSIPATPPKRVARIDNHLLRHKICANAYAEAAFRRKSGSVIGSCVFHWKTCGNA